MALVIGIDLGTTNFAICTIVDGKPKMLADAQGQTIFPSAVFKQGDEWIVGHRAKTARLKDPDLGAYAVKRLMGLKYDSEERRNLEQFIGLNIVPQEDGDCAVIVADEQLSPSQIASKILAFCQEVSREALGQDPDELVITVPAYFNHAQRQATKDAATLLGLSCHRIINEPTAAAVAYGMKAADNVTVLIYDLGGGTFDVSLLHFGGGIVETLATCGDTFLGGEDFDHRLVDYLSDVFEAEHEIDLRQDPIAFRRLKDAAEAAKCELSFQEGAMVYLPHIHGGKDLQVNVSRVQFEGATEELVDRSLEVVQMALDDAVLKASDIDQIVLVGGQTRMPLVREKISDFFKKEPCKGVHPDEVVATGAAIHASSLQGEIDAPLLFDVTPFDLGIDIQAGLFQKIITKNSRIPTSASKVFSTGQKGKTRVKIVVRQGASRFAKENEFLGEFRVDNLSLREDGRGEVEVMFRIDGNGMLNVTAMDTISKRKIKIQMRSYGEFIREEIPPELPPDEVNSSTASIGLGDSSASGGLSDIKDELDDKISSLGLIEEEASQQELDASSHLVSGLEQETGADDGIDISAEIDAINSLIGTMQLKEKEAPENDGMSMALDLSWLEEFEDQVNEETKNSPPVPPEDNSIELTLEPQQEDVIELVAEADQEVIELMLEPQQEDVIELVAEPVLELTPEDGDAIFELVPETEVVLESSSSTEVGSSDIDVLGALLDQVLHSGFENDIHLPEDDFFSTLRTAITGKKTSVVKKESSAKVKSTPKKSKEVIEKVKEPVLADGAIELLDEPLELVVENAAEVMILPPEVLRILDELFED